MPDYEVPPEVNSGRMYAGLGSASLLDSAAAWQALSVQLGSAGAAFQAVIEALTSTAWLGPSSMTMALAAAPYVVWMIATAEQCQAAAVGAGAAAAAFEAARAGVVPPPVIAENRAQLAALLSTNFMGFNTPAIMANEAHYGQMWAQDTATMYSFAGQASGITGTLIPFTSPAANSDPVGLAAQAAALGQSGGTAAGQQPMNFASSARFARRFRQPDDAVDGSAAGQQHSPGAAGAFLTVEWRAGVKRTGSVPVTAEPIHEFYESGHVRRGRGVGGDERGRARTCGAGRGGLGSGGRGGPGGLAGRVVGAGDLDGWQCGVHQYRAGGRSGGRLGWGDVCGGRPGDQRGLRDVWGDADGRRYAGPRYRQ